MALTETDVCNLALARIGAKRIKDIATGDSNESIQSQLHYAATRDMLLRSHNWNFALSRAAMVATTAPAFEWVYAFTLPADCLRVLGLYDRSSEYVVEGGRLLTDDSTASLRYIRKVADPAEFDALFVECLVLALAGRLAMALSQDKGLRDMLHQEFRAALSTARLTNMIEAPQPWQGQSWNESRGQGVTNPKQVTP